jgi:hypothetical protein
MDLSINSEHRLRSKNLSSDIDVWYPIMQHYTFKSAFIPFTVEERDSIIKFNDVSWKNVTSDNLYQFMMFKYYKIWKMISIKI